MERPAELTRARFANKVPSLKHCAVPGNFSTATHALVKSLAPNMQQLPVLRLSEIPVATLVQPRLGWRRQQQLWQRFELAMLVLSDFKKQRQRHGTLVACSIRALGLTTSRQSECCVLVRVWSCEFVCWQEVAVERSPMVSSGRGET